MTPTLKKILKWGGIAVAVALIIYIAMNFLGKGTNKPAASTGGLVSSSGSNPIAAAPASSSPSPANESQVVALLKNLSALRLEASIFSNPAFAVLQDISIQLQPVTTQGRRNPFAPIGATTASGTATTAGTPSGAVLNTASGTQ